MVVGTANIPNVVLKYFREVTILQCVSSQFAVTSSILAHMVSPDQISNRSLTECFNIMLVPPIRESFCFSSVFNVQFSFVSSEIRTCYLYIFSSTHVNSVCSTVCDNMR